MQIMPKKSVFKSNLDSDFYHFLPLNCNVCTLFLAFFLKCRIELNHFCLEAAFDSLLTFQKETLSTFHIDIGEKPIARESHFPWEFQLWSVSFIFIMFVNFLKTIDAKFLPYLNKKITLTFSFSDLSSENWFVLFSVSIQFCTLLFFIYFLNVTFSPLSRYKICSLKTEIICYMSLMVLKN